MAEQTINLMPEPGTPEMERFRQHIRTMYADPKNVRFRQELTRDGANIGWMTNGGTDPLPEVKDPLRDAIEVKVTLLLETARHDVHLGKLTDPDWLLRLIEEALREKLEIFSHPIIDVLLPENPKLVRVLTDEYYTEGSHFTNPLDGDPVQ